MDVHLTLHGSLEIAAVVCEIAGLWLLAREVWLGHTMEEVSSSHEWARQMNYLYHAGDYRGFYIYSRLYRGDSPDQVKSDARWIDPKENFETAAKEEWAGVTRQLAAAVARYKHRTEPAAMRRRWWLLRIGTGLLILAALLTMTSALTNETSPADPPAPVTIPTGWSRLEDSPPFAIGASRFDEPVPGCPTVQEAGEAATQWLNAVSGAWLSRPQPADTDTVILIGTADRAPLKKSLRRQYGSNMGLARARAETIKDMLVQRTLHESLANRLTPDRVLVQIAGPAYTPKPDPKVSLTESCHDINLSRDRVVQLWIPTREAKAENPSVSRGQ
jgi:hypothetical protein